MQTIPIELSDRLASLLDRVCMDSPEMRQRVVSELVVRYLEDIEDAAEASRVLAENNPRISLHAMRKELGLEQEVST